MTEAEWLACADPQQMLEFLRGRASERKLRLFACACCRSTWQLLANTKGREAVEASERYAEGVAGQRELAKAGRLAQYALTGVYNARPPMRKLTPDARKARCILAAAITAAKCSTEKDASQAAMHANVCAAQTAGHQAAPPGALATYDTPDTHEELSGRRRQFVRHCRFLHDIFGNPFRPSPALPPAVLAWNDGTVGRLARRIYEERWMPEGTLDTARLSILADALEDAGCDNPDLLGHLRGPGLHVRGCWAVDAVRSVD
jgi:hypothetical protein